MIDSSSWSVSPGGRVATARRGPQRSAHVRSLTSGPVSPVRSVRSAHVRSAHVRSAHVSGPVPVRTRPVRTRPVRTRPVRTRPVRTRPVRYRSGRAAVRTPEVGTSSRSRIPPERRIVADTVMTCRFSGRLVASWPSGPRCRRRSAGWRGRGPATAQVLRSDRHAAVQPGPALLRRARTAGRSTRRAADPPTGRRPGGCAPWVSFTPLLAGRGRLVFTPLTGRQRADRAMKE